MNADTIDPHRARSRLWRAGVLVSALVGLGILAAACSSGSASPGVASLGSTTTTAAVTAAQGGSNAKNHSDAVAYAGCMRTHGVPNMPDPTSNGSFLEQRGVLNGQHVDTGSPRFTSANKACQHLLPNGGVLTPAEQQKALAQALKYVQCMRSHGIPAFHDPVARGGGVTMHPPSGLGPDSPELKTANNACQSLLGSGGP